MIDARSALDPRTATADVRLRLRLSVPQSSAHFPVFQGFTANPLSFARAAPPPAPCHPRAITAGPQETSEAARDRETRSEAGTWPRVRAVPKLTVRVRFPSPAPHAKSVAGQGNPDYRSSRSTLIRVRNGTRAISRALAILANGPGDSQYPS
jgi:hypothetical protein